MIKAFVINLDSRPDRMEQFKENKFPFKVERVSGAVKSCGQDGCTESHLSILNFANCHNMYPFVVFEDDCVMLEPWEEVEKIIEQLPKDWDALWLGASITKHLHKANDSVYKLTHGYALHAVIYNSKRMVDFILENHHTDSGVNLDIFIARQVQKQFNCYIPNRIMATQRQSYSDISKQDIDFQPYIQKQFKKYAL